jgi:hypothetical protein
LHRVDIAEIAVIARHRREPIGRTAITPDSGLKPA